jgi:hypothetical protein
VVAGWCSWAGCSWLAAVSETGRPVGALMWARRENFFYIFIFSGFRKHIWFATNLAKIYICRRRSRCQGLNAAAHGVRSRQEWARRPNAKGHGVISLTP